MMGQHIYRVMASYVDMIGRSRSYSRDFHTMGEAEEFEAQKLSQSGRWVLLAEMWKEGSTTHCKPLRDGWQIKRG